MRIHNNAALTSLQGLENLTNIDGSVRVSFNAALTSLQGLENLTTVGTFLLIDNNAALTELSSLSALDDVGDHLRIYENPDLCPIEAEELATQLGKTIQRSAPSYAYDEGYAYIFDNSVSELCE